MRAPVQSEILGRGTDVTTHESSSAVRDTWHQVNVVLQKGIEHQRGICLGLVTPKGSVIFFTFLFSHILEIVSPLESLFGQISKSSGRLGHRIAFYDGRTKKPQSV